MTKINVNGKDHELTNVSGETPLLWVLRDHLGLTGTKYGCGISECGACTVHLDGVAVQSCVTSLADVGDSKVVTIEGLSQHGDHPVQKASIDAMCPQCGYCQSGQMMMAASLLEKNLIRQINKSKPRCGTSSVAEPIHASELQLKRLQRTCANEQADIGTHAAGTD